MNALNANCSKCAVFLISAPVGINGKPYCLRHLPKRKASRGARRIRGTRG